MGHTFFTVYTVLTTCLNYFYVIVFHSLSHVQLFATPWTVAHQVSLSFTISDLSVAQTHVHWVGDAIQPSYPVAAFSCPQSFPASGSFPLSWLFASGGQSIGASASVLPVNVQGWFPLELTGLISLLSMGLSRVFSSATVSISSLALSLLYGPTLKSIHDCWKNHGKVVSLFYNMLSSS